MAEMDRDLPFAFIVGWIAVGLAVSVLSTGGTPHDASAAMMLVAAGGAVVAAWRGQP